MTTVHPDSIEQNDTEQHVFSYGRGGVPWPLLLLYLGFLAFFTWYVLEYQLPDYMEQGPGQMEASSETR